MLKYMPEIVIKTFDKTLLFSGEQVIMLPTLDRRSHNSATAANRPDASLTDSLTKFHTYIEDENVYHVPLRF